MTNINAIKIFLKDTQDQNDPPPPTPLPDDWSLKPKKLDEIFLEDPDKRIDSSRADFWICVNMLLSVRKNQTHTA